MPSDLPDEPTTATDARAGGSIRLRGLTVSVGDRRLLDDVSVHIPAGKVTLIVGRSGVGKSILLRVLAGLATDDRSLVSVSGQLAIGGSEPDGVTRGARVGVVFQHFALFDELSPRDNVRLARAHGRPGSAPEPERLLDELGVPAHLPTSALSGGQRQRLAIARTLASDPDVVLYDEPTSGLDSATSRQVAQLIRRTHQQHGKTSIIVTHDYRALAPIADEIFWLDGTRRRLVRLERNAWEQLEQQLAADVGASRQVPSPAAAAWPADDLPGRLGALGRRAAWHTAELAADTTRVLQAALAACAALVPRWRSPRWGGRYALHYLRLVAGPSAWLYLAVAGAILGFVSTYFTFRFLPYPQYTRPLLTEDLLASIGFALYRVLMPVLGTVLIAARCGAAVASDIGGKAYGQQLDALRTLDVPPGRYLLSNILYAFLIGTPLLTLVGFVVARWTSLAVFVALEPDRGPAFWQLHFHRQLVDPQALLYAGTGWLLAKLLVCALGIAAIAYGQGARPKQSGRDVSRAITRTILWSTLYVLLVHFGFAFYEFDTR